MAKYWGTPPFITQIFFFQNDLKWLEMDFKHNFLQLKPFQRLVISENLGLDLGLGTIIYLTNDSRV